MASFTITRRSGQVFEVLVADEDLDRVLAAGPWHIQVEPHTTYVKRTVRIGGKKTGELLHRFLAGAPAGVQVDHINCNGLDNRRENLRAASQTQNQGNARRRRDNTSGFKGVYWDNRDQRWVAQIKVNRRNRNLGYFDTAEDAAAAYASAAALHFREFARTD